MRWSVTLWRKNKEVAYVSQSERKIWREASEKIESGPQSCVSTTVK